MGDTRTARENKMKEENRWQFFTSFLKRGLGTRGESLNRFYRRAPFFCRLLVASDANCTYYFQLFRRRNANVTLSSDFTSRSTISELTAGFSCQTNASRRYTGISEIKSTTKCQGLNEHYFWFFFFFFFSPLPSLFDDGTLRVWKAPFHDRTRVSGDIGALFEIRFFFFFNSLKASRWFFFFCYFSHFLSSFVRFIGFVRYTIISNISLHFGKLIWKCQFCFCLCEESKCNLMCRKYCRKFSPVFIVFRRVSGNTTCRRGKW